MDSPAPVGPRPSSHGFWIAALILLTGAASVAGAFVWHRWARDPFRGALAVSPEEFLYLKGKGFMKEVWVYGSSEVVAELRHGFMKNERVYQRIWTGFPPVFPQDAEALKSLFEGVPPGMVHYIPRR